MALFPVQSCADNLEELSNNLFGHCLATICKEAQMASLEEEDSYVWIKHAGLEGYYGHRNDRIVDRVDKEDGCFDPVQKCYAAVLAIEVVQSF